MTKFIGVFLFVLFIRCNSNLDNKNFELCNNNLNPYYYPELKYKGDFYAIKKHFQTNYTYVKDINTTGIIRIQFNVNCKGEVGDFSIETYTLDYKKTTLNTELIHQFTHLCKTLNEWIPAFDKEGNNIDSHKFLAFRLIDGKLIDILPK